MKFIYLSQSDYDKLEGSCFTFQNNDVMSVYYWA